ncbi:hypothetical protein BY458DRAFT_495508 [Sporodiniella umbellata]|nr:hypothetical protein BY458DRAFT_495508 [Sporodiniella umbellata]
MTKSLPEPQETSNYKKIPFKFTEQLSPSTIFFRLPDEFSPLERMILQSSGNLQRILSSYYNTPSHIEILRNTTVPQPKSTPVEYEREINMYFSKKFVYNAESVLTVEDKEVIDLIENQKYGLGQIFGHTHKLPEFTLLSVGRHGDGKGAGFWRDYTLSIPKVLHCTIRETFIEGLFEEFKGNRSTGYIWLNEL